MQSLVTESDYNRFLEYITLKVEIVRLAEMVKEAEGDKENKVRDLE